MMMGSGTDGGCCGTEEEKPCRVISRVSSISIELKKGLGLICDKFDGIGIDLYTQAKKALAERSPFDTVDAAATSASSQVSSSVHSSLPSGLANLLGKNSDRRKRHKRSHFGSEMKRSKPGGVDKARGSNVWVDTEQYFRELTVEDIDRLDKISSFGFSATDKCFMMPCLGNGNGLRDNGDVKTNANANGVGTDNGVVVKDGVEEEVEEAEELMEVDSVGASVSAQDEKGGSLTQSSRSTPLLSGLEWVLGSRSKIYLTSERPSKKRKFLGGQAGLEKLLAVRPVEGSSSLCHCCSQGDMGDQLNRLIVCSSCGMAVHQRCYGVQDDFTGSWLCSWCKQKNAVLSSDRPCVLCPKQGGALKPVHKRGLESDSLGYAEHAHLFCGQWMPEVYIEDTRQMEPLMNVDGIKETRKKLICNICKVKFGACVRCSNGACRTSFHPICAREAKHRMEIWGKLGCDDVELRAFCSKHSEVLNTVDIRSAEDHVSVAPDSGFIKHPNTALTVNKPHKLRITRRNGDKISVHLESTGTDCNTLGNSTLSREALVDGRLNCILQPDSIDAQKIVNRDKLETTCTEDAKTADLPNFVLILKKLIDQGKVKVQDVALETGVSPDLLASMLTDDCLAPEMRCKIVDWLGSHAYFGTLPKNLKVKIKPAVVSKAEMGLADDSNAVLTPESADADAVPFKSVPPRRTKSNIKIMRDNKVICSSKEMIDDDDMALVDDKSGQLVSEDQILLTKDFASEDCEKILAEPVGIQDVASNSSKPKGDADKPSDCNLIESSQAEIASIARPNTQNSRLESHVSSVDGNYSLELIKTEDLTKSFVHPLIQKELMQFHKMGLSGDGAFEYDGSSERAISPSAASSSSGICCNQWRWLPSSPDLTSKYSGINLEQLAKAKSMGILELSPVDEVEGELIHYQHKLLSSAVARKHFSDDLIFKILKTLPQEIDAIGQQKWDSVLVNQYLCDLREAKRQGRKERRHKEAQAVLAAATAAAAASSRVSSVRNDNDESAQQENLLKLNTYGGRVGLYIQQTLSRSAVARISSAKNSDFVHLTSEFSKEQARTCDICRRSETLLSPILVCASCKVSVHLDCYRSIKDSTGPWYCELCEDLLSAKSFAAAAINSWEKPYLVAECGLCGGTAGAFRKSTDGQWIHAFCAEWVFESTFRRGQVNPIEGMETISKGSDICHICRRKQGVCIKCNYGHCQSTFHPSCGRSAGFYMMVKPGSGKSQHRAYCERHSLEQRAKAETQKHGIEQLKSLKQARVELERLRLLCERIIKREKLKRELVFCAHHIQASRRDSVAFSTLLHSSYCPPDGSSESATTSLKGYTDGYRSESEAIQRSDDITVDSTVVGTVAGKHRVKFPVAMDNDQKTDDSSTSQNIIAQKPIDRLSFSGKQIPHRPSVASYNLLDGGERRSSYRKHTETFEKELSMTSDQASMRNQRLPKGFVYVPIRCLSKEKDAISDACPQETLQGDG